MKKLFHILLASLAATVVLPSCEREPGLHLHKMGSSDRDWPMLDIEVELDPAYISELGMVYPGEIYDWRSQWIYGWDDVDKQAWGPLELEAPNSFYLRRYYLGFVPGSDHKDPYDNIFRGYTYSDHFKWGYWDLLTWNNITTIDNEQSLRYDEDGDHVVAYTGESTVTSRYAAPRYAYAFWQPEALFSAYKKDVDVMETLEGFYFDVDNNVWRKKVKMELEPRSYVYLIQLLLRNNNGLNGGGTIKATDGNSLISGMARSVNINTGVTGKDAVSVYYQVRMKQQVKRRYAEEYVDVIGGRVLTFGMTDMNAYRVARLAGDGRGKINDNEHHYVQYNCTFGNGIDSTLVFDVTSKVRRHMHGGVITIELDMDTVPNPIRRGGSGFDAVVVDPTDSLVEIDFDKIPDDHRPHYKKP